MTFDRKSQTLKFSNNQRYKQKHQATFMMLPDDHFILLFNPEHSPKSDKDTNKENNMENNRKRTNNYKGVVCDYTEQQKQGSQSKNLSRSSIALTLCDWIK